MIRSTNASTSSLGGLDVGLPDLPAYFARIFSYTGSDSIHVWAKMEPKTFCV